MSDSLDLALWVVLVVAPALIVYFIPSFMAHWRRKENLMAIVTLNLLAGWTVVGWIGALVWALTLDRRPR
jgi:T4 superinfection immunity protein